MQLNTVWRKLTTSVILLCQVEETAVTNQEHMLNLEIVSRHRKRFDSKEVHGDTLLIKLAGGVRSAD